MAAEHIDWSYPTPESPPGRFWGAIWDRHHPIPIPQKPPALPVTTIVCLELVEVFLLGEHRLWSDLLDRRSHEDGWTRTVWGVDVNEPQKAAIVIDWKDTAPTATEIADELLATIKPLLTQRAVVYNVSCRFGNAIYLEDGVVEFMFIHGTDMIEDGRMMASALYTFQTNLSVLSCEGIDRDSPSVDESYPGWALDHNIGPAFAQCIVWLWRSEEQQKDFKDPTADSTGDPALYEKVIARPLRLLEQSGVRVMTITTELTLYKSYPASVRSETTGDRLRSLSKAICQFTIQ